MLRRWIGLIVLWLLPVQAHAAWQEASSTHFLVYGNTAASSLQKICEQLERYHSAMSLVTGIAASTPSPSNRVTVFLVPSEGAVRKLMGVKESSHIAGFYVPRAGQSFAIIPTVENVSVGDDLDFSMVILLHEYAHHFIITNSGVTYPRWMGEGAAEFFASAKFERNGTIWIGAPANHRGPELFLASDVTATDLLDPESYAKRRGKSTSFDAYYGKSWLLYHYLYFNKAREGQVRAYLNGMRSGLSQRDAAVQAFGDFKVLEKELDVYLRANKISAYKLPPDRIRIDPVTVRALSAGEAAMMPVRIRSRVGVDAKTAPVVLVDARAVAEKFPQDPTVLTALSEAEHDAGNEAEAIAAADKAIALDPKQANAYVQKGYAMFAQAEKAGGGAGAYRAARGPFLALNRIENDHPLPLFYFYLSFIRGGLKPTPTAVDGLYRAAALAPFDFGIRMMVAQQATHDGDKATAKANLEAVAYSPHENGLTAKAKMLLDGLDAAIEVAKADRAKEAAAAPAPKPKS